MQSKVIHLKMKSLKILKRSQFQEKYLVILQEKKEGNKDGPV